MPSWCQLGANLGHFGASLEVKGGPRQILRMLPGAYGPETIEKPMVFNGFWFAQRGLLGPSWGRLGAILGPSWGHLGASWGHLGASLGHLRAILGPSWCHLGAILWPFWDILGSSWGHLERTKERNALILQKLPKVLRIASDLGNEEPA